MTVFAFIPIILFVIGAGLSRWGRVSYCFAAAGSIGAGAVAVGSGGLLDLTLRVAPGILVGLRLDHISELLLLVSAIAWTALSLAAVGSRHRSRPRIPVGFNLSLVGIYLVFLSADAVIFLIGWELMTIFAFLMILPDTGEPGKAFRFLAFGELSSVSLMIGFGVLYATHHTLALSGSGIIAPAFLIFATLGAVVKMDVVPFHTWMREVYERLPGFVAGFMSVAVTLAGVYALERSLSMAAYVRWWDLTLILVGAVTAFWGALRSTVLPDLRGVPAYSTVEYSGMILCAAGLSAAAGAGTGDSLRYLGEFAGAAVLMLALSHALAKSLFFISLGDAADHFVSVRFGGLRSIWRNAGRLPAIGIAVAGLSFAAFPPFAGYVGEWMLLETTFQSFRFASFGERFVASLSGVFLALAIGLIAFTMAKYIGYVVLGNEETQALPRDDTRAPSRGRLVGIVEIALAVLVAAAGIGLPALLLFAGHDSLLSGLLAVPKPLLLVSGVPTFGVLSPTFFAVVILVLTGIPLAVWLRRRRGFRVVAPWSGGRPAAEREGFTPAAFSQILAFVLRAMHATTETTAGAFRSLTTSDRMEKPYAIVDRESNRLSEFLGRSVMNGRIHWYVFYILLTLALVLMLAAV